MLEQILKELNNYFYITREIDNFSIEEGRIQVKGVYKKNQYIRIIDSLFNDGVFKITNVENDIITVEGLIDEDFQGVICALAIPRDIIKLADEVAEYNIKYKDSPYQSESVPNYSYTKALNRNGTISTWKDTFATRLKPYRKMFDNLGYVKEV